MRISNKPNAEERLKLYSHLRCCRNTTEMQNEWFVYNQFWPTEDFKASYRNVFQLIIPIACLAVGWKWFRYKEFGIRK